ncbi:hypothetical protein IQ235_13905 [Oscillatoriales cyanobacterium LEGE 11467]|uniref:Uncharacterized protein n=1 Tax=Zarconia navalis LEGE 11467 TaxID=1828826 RepID=A0A928Z9M9_9CYAN|nr:hypothetical protein [Zarconia navalis]MBE9041874.1 hypothetical protein [Zarconia navalis LEGE 11467]
MPTPMSWVGFNLHEHRYNSPKREGLGVGSADVRKPIEPSVDAIANRYQ